MKKYFHVLIYMIALLAFASCTSEDEYNDNPKPKHYLRTVIVYMTGDNNLADSLNSDFREMIAGSRNIPDDCKYIVFADNNSVPTIYDVNDGKSTVVRKWENDFYTTLPDSMLSVYKWIIQHYPSDEYATVIEGHGTGAIIRNDTVATQMTKLHAYGYDNAGHESATSTSTWMNIPSMATVFSRLPHMEYIFFDCCCMQNVETAYELRKYTDYIIAPVSETPWAGAPYKNIIPTLYAETPSVGDSIIHHYIHDSNWKGKDGKIYGGICISVAKTSELDSLMFATRKALSTIKRSQDEKLVLKKERTIYYYRGSESNLVPVLHDMKNIMLNNLSAENYNEWLTYFNKVIVSKFMPEDKPYWQGVVNFDFTVEKSNYGAMSMIVPNDDYDYSRPYPSINKAMFLLEWSKAIGWDKFGWQKTAE